MRKQIKYTTFDNNIAGLTAMIFVQCFQDAHMLRKYKKRSLPDHDGGEFTMDDIIKFCQSEWADYLAGLMQLDIRDVRAWADTLVI